MAWWNILTPIVETVGKYVNKRQEIGAAKGLRKDELIMAKHQAQVARIANGDKVEADYDKTALQNMATTFKDEFLMIWTVGVVTCLFIPTLQETALAGFVALATVPIWFQVAFVGLYISTFGLRFLSGKMFGK